MKTTGRKIPYKKTALAFSLCSLLLWAILGTGTMLAWFADTAPEINNLFHTADFDLTVSYQETDGTWVEVTEQTELFDKNAKYEPGYVQVVYLKVDNTGTRSFVFHTAVNVNGCVVAANAFSQQFMLQDYLKFGITVSDTPEAMKNSIPNRAAAVAIANQSLRNYATDTAELLPGDTKYVTLIVRMPEKVNNLANYRGDAVPTVELGITVKADQN